MVTVMAVAAVATALAACGFGPVRLGLGDLLRALVSGPGADGGADIPAAILWNLRLPRAMSAAVVGAVLAVAGSALQSLFRNPLADPAIIGVSMGAACGAVTGFTLLAAVPGAASVLALSGGLGVTFLIYQLARLGDARRVERMLLIGIAINAMGAAYVGLILTLGAEAYQVRRFVFWTLGSLTGSTTTTALTLLGLGGAATAWLMRRAGMLDALLIGEAEAFALGVPIRRARVELLAISAVLAAACVAACGTIGFIGLVAPHIARLLVGPGQIGRAHV